MATVKVPPPVRGQLPRELLEPQHVTWREPARFVRWCAQHDVDPTVSRFGAVTWFDRFTTGRDRWARANGFASGSRVDHDRLEQLGVPFVGSLSRAAAAAEVKDPDGFRCTLQSYGSTLGER